MLLAKEIAGCIDAGDAVERNQPRAAFFTRAWLVETDMPSSPHAQNLNIDTARRRDLLLVPGAIIGDLLDLQRAIRNMPIARGDIHEVEQMLAHEPQVALQLIGLHGEVFIEIERHDVRERQTLFAMQPHELIVNADRRAARGEPEHAVFALGGTLAN